MLNWWKILSQQLHFLGSPLLLNLLTSGFHDHQNTAIILSKVTYNLLLFAVFILELCGFPWGSPTLLDSSFPCSLFVWVTIQFWFSSFFSDQLWHLLLTLAGGYYLKFCLQSCVLFVSRIFSLRSRKNWHKGRVENLNAYKGQTGNVNQ